MTAITTVFPTIALLLTLATVLDWKTKQVPNWIAYAIGVGGLLGNAIVIITSWDYKLFFLMLAIIPATSILGILLYEHEWWRGADLKMFVALALTIPESMIYFTIFLFLTFLATYLIAKHALGQNSSVPAMHNYLISLIIVALMHRG